MFTALLGQSLEALWGYSGSLASGLEQNGPNLEQTPFGMGTNDGLAGLIVCMTVVLRGGSEEDLNKSAAGLRPSCGTNGG